MVTLFGYWACISTLEALKKRKFIENPVDVLICPFDSLQNHKSGPLMTLIVPTPKFNGKSSKRPKNSAICTHSNFIALLNQNGTHNALQPPVLTFRYCVAPLTTLQYLFRCYLGTHLCAHDKKVKQRESSAQISAFEH